MTEYGEHANSLAKRSLSDEVKRNLFRLNDYPER